MPPDSILVSEAQHQAHADERLVPTGAASHSDLSREVYCILGMPVDAVDMAGALQKLEAAAAGGAPFLVSTPNLNFLVNIQSDEEFRDTLLDSDLCLADGLPIIWIARIMGLPIRERVAGSDMFDALKSPARFAQQLSVFLFGGAQGAAAAVAAKLHAEPCGLRAVGSLDPGFLTVEEMSRDDIIDVINASNADLLAVFLGAKKGQLWLHRNHDRLRVPIRVQLGATVNFQAGTVRRAPRMVRAWGFEWLWRIKEEPYLWRRYWNDGRVLLRLLVTRVLPLLVVTHGHRLRSNPAGQELVITTRQDQRSFVMTLRGAAVARNIDTAIACFRSALAARRHLVAIDFSEVRAIDARFLGLLLMLRKGLKERGGRLELTGVSGPTARSFRLNELRYLLTP